MRITCRTIDELLEDLSAAVTADGPDAVLQRTLRLSADLRPMDGQSPAEAVRFDVTLHASAVVRLKDGGEYLLRAALHCGIDYADASQEYAGSEELQRKRDEIRRFCDARGLVVGPGLIEE